MKDKLTNFFVFSLQSLAEIVLTDDVMATMELILNKVDVSCVCHYALK